MQFSLCMQNEAERCKNLPFYFHIMATLLACWIHRCTGKHASNRRKNNNSLLSESFAISYGNCFHFENFKT